MVDVAIRRLRVRGAAERSALAAFRIGDGCRSGLADGERLVLLRTLRLPAAAAGPHPTRRADAVARAWQTATSAARHGAADRAGESECVWFASREEARRLLLALLLAGRTPNGWYWRLAVPDWEGATAVAFVSHEVARALAAGGGALPRLALEVVEAGRADLFIAALEAATRGPEAASVRPTPHARGRAMDGAAAVAPASPDPREAEVAAMLASLCRALPPRLREAVEGLVRTLGVRTRASALLLERLLLQAAPELSLSPPRLTLLAKCYGLLLTSRLEDPAPSPTASSSKTARDVLPSLTREPPAGPSKKPEETPLFARTPESGRDAHAEAEPPRRRPDQLVAPTAVLGHVSAAAGLWLVVPSLIRLGWREWLLTRPDLLGAAPGRTLLLTLAAHHRVAFDDPALLPFALDAPPPAPPAWADAWRRALTRALRRGPRVNVARLVCKAGRIAWEDDRLVVRFPLAAADLRLRRRALDVDPGWVDWLGFSVRYLFTEEGAR